MNEQGNFELMSYGCVIHGGYQRPSHHCLSCIEEAKGLLVQIIDGPRNDLIHRLAEKSYTLINQNIGLDGKPAGRTYEQAYTNAKNAIDVLYADDGSVDAG